MKNSLFKFFAGVSIFASLFAVNVHALGVEDGNNSASESVTVGSVQTPVYSVDISWGEFSYDWVYDSSTGEFGWEKTEVESCVLATQERFDENTYVSALNKGQVYSDESCTTPNNLVEYRDIEYAGVYMKEPAPSSSNISIKDSSTAGQIVPSIEWIPSAGYEWVTGKFNYTEFADRAIDGGVIPEDAIVGSICGEGGCTREYSLNFEIGIDSSKEITTPKANDTIGQITVSIAAKE